MQFPFEPVHPAAQLSAAIPQAKPDIMMASIKNVATAQRCIALTTSYFPKGTPSRIVSIHSCSALATRRERVESTKVFSLSTAMASEPSAKRILRVAPDQDRGFDTAPSINAQSGWSEVAGGRRICPPRFRSINQGHWPTT